MSTPQRKPERHGLTEQEARKLIMFAAVLFGALFRFLPAAMAGFPANDGGMFYTMMHDLQAAGFRPPDFTSYNNIQIPFAYPPLALFIGAFASQILHISLADILRWLPALISTLCIPALYYFARDALRDELRAALAALLFALSPHLNTWLSAGGGLTRSFGTLFMLLTLLHVQRLFRDAKRSDVWLSIIFGAFTVLSHTESTVVAMGLAAYLWLMISRNRTGLLQATWVAGGVIPLAGPWYAWVIHHHGWAPLLSALQTGGHGIWSFARLINIHQMTEEPYLDLIGALGLLGIAYSVFQRRYFVPLMLVALYMIEPRSAHTLANIPLSLAGADFLALVLLQKFGVEMERGMRIFLFTLAPYLLVNAIYQGYLFSRNHVTPAERTAMNWITQNTVHDVQFIVLTGEPESMCQAAAEWFPALTERTSLATVQGREWLLGGSFNDFIAHQRAIQACTDQDEACLNREMRYFSNSRPYVFITTRAATYDCKAAESPKRETRGLIISLLASTDYELIYRTPAVAIFTPK